MTKSAHPHFTEEQEILQEVWIECNDELNSLQKLIQKKHNRKKRAIQNDKEGSGEVSILKRDITLLDEEASAVSARLRKPYFGKITYKVDNTLHTIYIGDSRYSCSRAEVHNWKSPIGGVYYSRKSSYSLPDKSIQKIELYLVRTLDVDRNILNNVHDNFMREIQPMTDPFLLEQLGRSGKERLQDIVVTIQEEQNEIIRAPIDKHLIVQGGAGTGKSIVSVYRVAYLMYTYGWKNDDVLFISPSKVFLGYLRSILPAAELATLSSTTLSDLIPQLGKNIFKNMTDFPAIMEISKKERQIASDAADFKGTTSFKNMIDAKIQEIAQTFTETIKGFNYTFAEKQEKIPAAAIRKMFLDDFSDYSFDQREKQIRQKLKSTLENLLENSLFNNRRMTRVYTPQETESMLANYFKDWPDFKKMLQSELMPWYLALLKSYREVGTALENAQTKISEDVSSWNRYFSFFTLNDWAAVFYMYQRLVGEKDRPYKMIVIDEAQMLSPLWLAGLSYMLAEGGTFYLTGDMNQKPAVIDLPDWSGYEEIIGSVELRELNKCYRLTDAIAKVALDILFKHPSMYRFESVGRFGEKVQEIRGTEPERLAAVTRETTSLLKQYESIAVIGRTTAHCDTLYQKLTSIFSETTLITQNDDLAGKILVIPVSFVGGLEFDAVVIMDHDKYDLEDIYEAKSLYLGITRAVHKLILA